ncbi:fused FliR family export protein/FlhB family type III secretion system protein [Haloimpatiens massiliensis]|uniref:fused FliR family export protein/FlhB family type III secretion system protein n=1 Tax=Haloimpatiens massiliensis TaxID=1658110 RepID=UPI000C848858|nr:fused FliR family export protein/FlhB family type III secretion system protein [Haloimpatiens massiliensis]
MLNVAYFTAFLLIFLRITSLFIASPIFFPKGAPKALTIGFCAILAYVLVSTVNYSALAGVDSGATLMFYCLNEILTGLMLGYIVRFCFFSISFAGQLIDVQIGFAMMNMFDPQTGSNVTVLSNLMYWLSVILFFLVDGHHILIRTLSESFTVGSLGKLLLTDESSMMVIKGFIDFFTIGFKIALPIILVIIITDLTLALVGRTVPQLNVMILGLPIKILVGLMAISIAIPTLIHFIVESFDKIPLIMRRIISIAPVIVIFTSEDKTEEATPKKKKDARKKGQVAKSKELGLTFTLLASTIVLVALGDFILNSLREDMVAFLNNYINMHIDSNNMQFILLTVMVRAALVILPVAIPIAIMGIIANFIQSGFLFTKETIKPDLKKLNPLSGLKRIFSMRTLVELFKDLAMIFVVAFVGYKYLMKNYGYILNLGYSGINYIPPAIKKLVVEIFQKVTLVMIAISLMDFIYQKRQYNKELRMTKQEIKEEFKQDEGDPQIKGKIKQMQREMASKRMMQSVPDATVIVTNPTHISVALKYEEGQSAPVVVAKGQGEVAAKIKEIAREYEIPIVENKPLARLMYKEVEIDSQIPVEMYEGVAEVLAIVYKLKKQKNKY